ncbi:hypothetical protein DYB34_008589 [Aphanomyces astaci]|uniref:Uncharacterized protein n=2 Tax=Aphanomyces astaci TaxID=112090 RepID=A0A3R7AUW2_APHAT|nr:hypothetical protein DYB34_008589 [Aphanomyces astaci]
MLERFIVLNVSDQVFLKDSLYDFGDLADEQNDALAYDNPVIEKMLKGQKKKNLTDSECNSMVQHLLLRCTKAGKIPMGAADEVAQFQHKKSTCGRNRLHKDLPKRIQAIPQSPRYCFRSLAHFLGMPKSTLHDYFKRGVFAKYSSVLKPALTESNKVCHLKGALDHVCDRDGSKFFDDMYDTLHVDEKWFFMTRLQKKVYGAIGEKIKQRSCKSKHHLLKVMFLTAVARPRWDETCGE